MMQVFDLIKDHHMIQFNEDIFHPDVILPVNHRLHVHPLMELGNLVQLAKRLPRTQVRFHATTATASSRFASAEQDHPHHLTLEEALEHIEVSGSWIALHNVQTDPLYCELLNLVLDSVQMRVGRLDPGMFNRAFWIFIQSPGSVTPFHMDHEQNFLMQIKGQKKAFVWPVAESLTNDALEAFHSTNSRDLAPYSSEMDAKALAFDLEPGKGVYMPFTSPHLVRNLDQVSITVSMTYCSRKTRFVETIHRCNRLLRKFGLSPDSVQPESVRDRLKYLGFNSMLELRARVKGQSLDVPYWSAI